MPEAALGKLLVGADRELSMKYMGFKDDEAQLCASSLLEGIPLLHGSGVAAP